MFDMRKLWREPLVHFLVIGAGLFLAFGLTRDQRDDATNRIVVDAAQVEQLAAQFRRTWLRPPTEQELAGLIESHVRDEVYYREALVMGLDQNDPQVRRRMRLKLEFLLEDLSAEEPPDDETLHAYLQRHPEKFRIEPQLSFKQVYLNRDNHQDLPEYAARMLSELRAGRPPDSVGDPTLLPHEQTAVSQREIVRTFGETFAEAVLALEPGVWNGPVYSGFGAHLVLVTQHRDGYLPELAAVRDLVEREYLAQRRRELKDLAYRKLREGYEVIVEPAKSQIDGAGPFTAATAEESSKR
jgi:hypothetical protein